MTPIYFLAKAAASDEPGSDLALTMTWLLLIAAVAIAAFVPFRLSSAGGRQRSEAFTVLVILWALIAAGCGIQTSLARARWSQDFQVRLQSGYYDPADSQNGPPPWPWKTWAGLAAGYGVLLVMAARGSRPQPGGFEVKTNDS